MAREIIPNSFRCLLIWCNIAIGYLLFQQQCHQIHYMRVKIKIRIYEKSCAHPTSWDCWMLVLHGFYVYVRNLFKRFGANSRTSDGKWLDGKINKRLKITVLSAIRSSKQRQISEWEYKWCGDRDIASFFVRLSWKCFPINGFPKSEYWTI